MKVYTIESITGDIVVEHFEQGDGTQQSFCPTRAWTATILGRAS